MNAVVFVGEVRFAVEWLLATVAACWCYFDSSLAGAAVFAPFAAGALEEMLA